ncbi:TPA: hypothetical protein CPT80_04585 [Candidatus Gastranaerophilales bacterium HUM_9]|nr:MAG TPA: hypothetical protein CPT80_04585 [Candidatus Gastranaerophilales bacterium HUM_9]
MGLSASQARLLSLTARQSNLEFEGQQINQQRTTLSNQSSNYYNSLLEMDVPVPPSSDDYTKIVYTFTIGGNEATVKEALPENQKNGTATYTVSYTTNLSTIGIKENSAYKTSASSSKTAKNIVSNGNAAYDENKSYYLAAMNRLDATSTVAADEQYVMLDSMPNPKPANLVVIGKNGYQIDADKYAAMSKEDQALCKIYRKANDTTDTAAQKYALSYTEIANANSFNYYSDKTGNSIYVEDKNNAGKDVYTYKSSNGSSFTTVDPQYADSFVNAGLNMDEYYQYETSSGMRFVKREDVEGNLNNQSVTVMTSAVGTVNVTTNNTLINATIEFDASGRISTITDEEGNTYTTTATTETDNDAYDDAYNQYEYNQYVYDQKQNEINASIEILQAQDKSLELRLSTLDTQHTAIQTELEAVKKVMSKNIDNSFKTFNA